MSSVTDVKEKAGAGGGDAGKSSRSNPVALEVPVSVTWAKPARPNEKRDLFTEETVTVLVFRDGAVIQLSAAITIGQLLFLTHKKTKREVVCQVVQKRSFRPTSCFVELEFTEDADNFWGVTFPDKEEGAHAPPIAEAVAAEEATEEDRGEPVAAPKSEDVAQLKDEVQTLRKQLQELKDKQTAEERHAAEEKKAAEEQEAIAKRLAETEAAARRAAEAEAESKKGAEQPKAAESAPGRPRIAMKLPSLGATLEAPAAPTDAPKGAQAPSGGLARGRKEEAQELDEIDDLLPKPALDFSKAKVVDPNDPFNIYKPARRPPGKLERSAAAGLGALLIVAAGVAWYMNRLPFLHRAPKASVTAKSAPAAPVAATPVAAPGKSPLDVTATPPTTAPSASTAPVAGETASGLVRPNTAAEVPSQPATNVTGSPEPVAPVTAANSETHAAKRETPATKRASEGTYVAARVSKYRGKAETSAESNPGAGVVSDAAVIPAKLLHAVQPVYPPDAMRNYITGDVRIEAQVDAKGHVGAMNIIFGPAAFRQAAMDALRQYQYEAATQGGKAVASKVVVTVKFWFDP